MGAGHPIFTLDALSEAEALSMLKELAVAMFAVGAEASVAFGEPAELTGDVASGSSEVGSQPSR